MSRVPVTEEGRRADLGDDWYEAYLERVAIMIEGARAEFRSERALMREAYLVTEQAKQG